MEVDTARQIVAYCSDQDGETLAPYNGYTVRVGPRVGVLYFDSAVPVGVGGRHKVTVDFCSSSFYGPASEVCPGHHRPPALRTSLFLIYPPPKDPGARGEPLRDNIPWLPRAFLPGGMGRWVGRGFSGSHFPRRGQATSSVVRPLARNVLTKEVSDAGPEPQAG